MVNPTGPPLSALQQGERHAEQDAVLVVCGLTKLAVALAAVDHQGMGLELEAAVNRTHGATAAATQLRDIWRTQGGRAQSEHGKPGHLVHEYNTRRFAFEADRVARWHGTNTEAVLSEYNRLGYGT